LEGVDVDPTHDAEVALVECRDRRQRDALGNGDDPSVRTARRPA
jgi:hypothetical protein